MALNMDRKMPPLSNMTQGTTRAVLTGSPCLDTWWRLAAVGGGGWRGPVGGGGWRGALVSLVVWKQPLPPWTHERRGADIAANKAA